MPLHTEAFTQRCFDIYTPIHTEAFRHRLFSENHRSFDTEKPYTENLLHTEGFTHTSFSTEAFTQRSFYAQELLHTDAFTHRSLYTRRLLRTAFAQRSLYTDAFPQKNRFHRAAFTRFKKSQFNLSFWRSAIISCERVASGVGKSQILTLDNHFAWKAFAWPCKIQFYTSFISRETVVPDVWKWINSQVYTNSWTFASGIKKSQFSHSYCHLTFVPRLHLDFQSQYYTSFWRLTLVSCEGAAPGLTKFAFCHMFGCPACAISVEGCPCPKEIHIPPHVWASETHDLRRRLLRAKPFPTPHVCPSDTRDLHRGLPKDKQDPHFATRLGVRHAAEGNGS